MKGQVKAFRKWWKSREAEGYQYGPGPLATVAFGFKAGWEAATKQLATEREKANHAMADTENRRTQAMTKLHALTTIGLTVIALTVGFTLGSWEIAAQRSQAYTQGIEEMRSAVVDCTLADAHADKCYIPCATDSDCLEKNGQSDH